MKQNCDSLFEQYVDGKLKLTTEQIEKWEEALELTQAIRINPIQGLAWNDMGLPKDNIISQKLDEMKGLADEIFWEINNVLIRTQQDEIVWKHINSKT